MENEVYKNRSKLCFKESKTNKEEYTAGKRSSSNINSLSQPT